VRPETGELVLKSLKRIVLAMVAAYLLLVAFVYIQQRSLMFLPTTDRILPRDVGLSDVSEIALETDDGDELFSWYAKAADGNPTILFFHGNGGSVPGRHGRFRQWMAEGFGLFMLGYPGYGGSGGSPSEDSFREASQLAYDYLKAQGVSANEIVVYGQSIGTGVAVQLASQNPAKALVLEAPMESALSVAKKHYPYLPVGLLLKDKFLSVDLIDKINMPLLIVHGDTDYIIGIENGQKLYASAAEPKAFFRVNGAGHNNLSQYPILEVIKEYVLTIGIN
jgi:pimeloyl-ACP methyl ester carboxylesterase